MCCELVVINEYSNRGVYRAAASEYYFGKMIFKVHIDLRPAICINARK